MRLKNKELKVRYADVEFLENFKRLFSLRYLFYNTIIKEGYTVPSSIGDSIVLTDYGLALLSKLRKGRFKETEEHLLKFSLLMEFYHEELIVDVLNTRKEEIENLLHNQILDGSLLYPWVYGRLLYDKYFEEFNEQEKILQHDDVVRLLEGTPVGVFQVGNYIVGSLGLAKSSISRFIPPQRNVKLWHCSDPACAKFHEVHLSSGNSLIPEIIAAIKNLLRNDVPSDWAEFYFDEIENENFYFDNIRVIETPYLLINVLGEGELKSLLKDVIDSDKVFRSVLPNKKQFQGASEDIVKNIGKDVCFQLLLLQSDEKNIFSLERLIDDQIIFIPSTEVRRPITRKARGFYGIHHECNKLGIRSVSAQANLGLRQLNNLLNKIYTESTIQQQLDWKLRFYEKETLKEKIEAYTQIVEPRKVIRDTVLSGPTQIAQTFKFLLGNFKMPLTIAEEEILIDKILWKLGFDINIYPNLIQKFWERLQKFKDTTQSCISFNDTDKENIRSAAVNFWISLEEILEHTLSFITWTLLSDHFGVTNFKFNFEDARNVMCEKLHGYKVGSGDPLIFDNKGKNTLFPLTEGFSALLEICNGYLAESTENFIRSAEEMPSFWNKAELTSFPFESKIHVLNIKPSNFKVISNLIAEIPKSFSKNNVLSVRNRTQHKRDDFPSQDEIMAACSAVENIVNKLEVTGIFPNVYLFKTSTVDKFNRVKFEYEDYKGRNITLQPTFEFVGSKLPERRKPQIIIPTINIGNSQEFLRFQYQETSSYLKFWANFPRKKESGRKEVKESSEANALTIEL